LAERHACLASKTKIQAAGRNKREVAILEDPSQTFRFQFHLNTRDDRIERTGLLGGMAGSAQA
jgi:hypothetical protein